MSSASDKNRGQIVAARPIQFQAFLPELFRPDQTDENGHLVNDFLNRFLNAFQTLFEGLEAEVEGTPGNDVQVTVQSASGTAVQVAPFGTGGIGFPAGTAITAVNDPALRAMLTAAVPPNTEKVTAIDVDDAAFVAALQPGDVLEIHAGGVPDLFSPDTTPPPQFAILPDSDLDYVRYLASWVALSLRTDAAQFGSGVGTDAVRGTNWNRELFKKAVALYPERGTLPGMDTLLRAWMKGDLYEPTPPLLILTDLTRTYNDIDDVFQLAPQNSLDAKKGEVYAQTGLNTVFGEGPPFFFVADLVVNPTVPELRTPVGLGALQMAARSLLDSEKPAYTYYQLRVRGPTMQLAPPEPVLQLTVVSTSGNTIQVASFNTAGTGYPSGTPVTISGKPTFGTTLSQPVASNAVGLTTIQVADLAFAEVLQPGDVLGVNIWGQLSVTALMWGDAWVFDSDC